MRKCILLMCLIVSLMSIKNEGFGGKVNDFIRVNQLSNKVRQSSVFITKNEYVSNRETRHAYGSGIIINKDEQYYYVLTNNQTVRPFYDHQSVEYEIRLFDEAIVLGECITEDLTNDLAILRFPVSNHDLYVTSIASNHDHDLMNDNVLVVGNTNKLQNIVLSAELKAVDDSIHVQLDADLKQPKGFALINKMGELIGITSLRIGSRYLAISSKQINDFMSHIDLLPKNKKDTIQTQVSSHVLKDIYDISTKTQMANIVIKTKLGEASTGSGVIYKKDDHYYYALTNCHVVGSDVNPKIILYNGVLKSSTVAAKCNSSFDVDLAILRFEIEEDVLPLIPIDFNHTLEHNDLLFVVGNPSGVQNIVTTTNFHGYAFMWNGEHLVNIRYDSPIELAGNSGGAVVDSDGYLVGIHTWSGSGDQKYALPLSVIKKFLESHDLL